VSNNEVSQLKISDYNLIESTMIEFKLSLEEKRPLSWLKTVSAFANTKGGTILFGIRDSNSELVGISDPNHAASKISELINVRIQPIPRYEINPIAEQGRTFLELKIGDGPAVPYYYVADGKHLAYIRSGDESIAAPLHVLNNLILKGQNSTFDALPSPYKIEDVSFTLLEATYKKENNDNFQRERDLVSFGLVKPDGYISYAGALICDQGLLRQSRIFCTRWKGTEKGFIDEDALDDKEYSGSIIALLENAEAFVMNNSKNRWSIRGLRREEKSDYPHAAVREAVVNAIIHRDYQIIGSEIHIDMYDDRMEISSPGGMLDGSRVQDRDLMRIPSIRRNQIISDLFHRLHFMERRGSGITRIIRTYDNCEKKPKFFSEASLFQVILPNRSAVNQDESVAFKGESVINGQESTDFREKTTLSQEEQLSEFSLRIAKLGDAVLREKTVINIVQMFKKFGYTYSFDRNKIIEQFEVKPSRASQIIRQLINMGIVEKHKNGEYVFKKA
jgi:ATP-dependent DNA helicase RecG